jgi:hypothetical protein
MSNTVGAWKMAVKGLLSLVLRKVLFYEIIHGTGVLGHTPKGTRPTTSSHLHQRRVKFRKHFGLLLLAERHVVHGLRCGSPPLAGK